MTTGPLAALAERALRWSAATTVARFALQMCAQVALARLLGPENYGIYGIGLTALTFVGFLSGASFAWTLLLLPRVTDEDIRFSFTWQLLVGCACALGLYAAAPALAQFFGDERVAGMVRLLSVASLLTAASAPAGCLLQRDLNFRALGLIQLAGYAAGYLVVGVPMALAGYGATTLGVAAVVQAAVVLVASYVARPHPLRPLFAHAGARAALATGRTVTLTNAVNWVLGNIDRVLIGRVLNAHAVGLYNIAYNLASVPNTLLIGAIHPTLLAAGAKLQDDPQRLGQAWQVALSSSLVFATPAAVVLALSSQDMVQVLYGPQWAESAWVLGLLFLCLPAWVSWAISTPVLWHSGRQHFEYRLQLPLLVLALPAWWIAAPSGIRGIAVVSAALIFARAAAIIVAAIRLLGLSFSVVGVPLARGLALAAGAGAALLAARHLLVEDAAPWVTLFSEGTTAVAVLLILAGAWPGLLGTDAHDVLARALPFFRSRRLPPLAPRPPSVPR